MFRLLVAFGYPIFTIPPYLEWSRAQSESQIDKMQRSVFNSPGMEAPVPPAVVVGGALLLVGYWLLMRLFGAPGWLRLLGLLVGAPTGVAIFMQQNQE